MTNTVDIVPHESQVHHSWWRDTSGISRPRAATSVIRGFLFVLYTELVGNSHTKILRLITMKSITRAHISEIIRDTISLTFCTSEDEVFSLFILLEDVVKFLLIKTGCVEDNFLSNMRPTGSDFIVTCSGFLRNEWTCFQYRETSSQRKALFAYLLGALPWFLWYRG